MKPLVFRPFDVFRPLQPFRVPLGDSKISQPVALEDPDTPGTYFVTAEGELLVQGTQRVEPQE